MLKLWSPKRVPLGYRQDVGQFIEAVRTVLENWLAIHTDPHAWVRNHMNEEPQYFFDLVRDPLGDYASYWLDASGSEELYYIDMGLAALRERLPQEERLLLDQDPESYHDRVSDEDLYRGMTGILFPRYIEVFGHEFAHIVEDVRGHLEAMDEADSAHDLLAATAMATQTYHLGGPIFVEGKGRRSMACASGFRAFELLDRVRNDGWEDAFGPRAFARFLTGFESQKEAQPA